MNAKALFAALVASLVLTAPAALAQEKRAEKPAQTQPDKVKDNNKDKQKEKKDKENQGKNPAKVGETAPTFTGTDSQGNTVSLSELTSQGKIVVIQWFNAQCPYVVKHYENGANTFNDIHSKYKDKGVVILAVNSGAPGKQGTGAEFNNKMKTQWKMEYPIILDESGEIGKAYGAQNTPAMAIIGKDGKLAYFGAIDDDRSEKVGKTNYVTKALDEMLAGKPVSTTNTRPYGCGIKY
jgi:peroxiredoxin